MADFEKIEIDPYLEEVTYERPDFAKVIFHNIGETYPLEAHVECAYIVTSSLTATSRDWIGLYKVGWSSCHDYVYFQWAPLQADYTPGSDLHGSVMYQAHTLPKDDGEFYQFCYVSSSGHVRGASTPFQFKKPSADDFVAVEDEDGMMIIQSKTKLLQEDLGKAVKEKEELQKAYSLLEEERESLLMNLVQTDGKLQSARDKKDEYEEKLENAEEKIETLTTQLSDTALGHDALKEKLGFLEQEKASILKRLDENEKYISDLQVKIKVLVNEKDALFGQCKTLEQEKEMLQNHFTNSENSVQSYKTQALEFEAQLMNQQMTSADLETKLRQLEEENDTRLTIVQSLATKLSTAERNATDLKEQLCNAEDKLAAADNCMKLRRDEVNALQQACEKISRSFEKAKSEAHMYKEKLEALEVQYKQEQVKWHAEHQTLVMEVQTQESEKYLLNNDLEEATTTLKAFKDQKDVERQGALYALKDAHSHLQKRFKEVDQKRQMAEKMLQEITMQKKEKEDLESDLRAEVRDLKERLSMGADEYKLKYLECRKLHSEVRKLKKEARRSNSTGSDRGFGPVPGHAQQIQTEAPVQRAASVETDRPFNIMTQTKRSPAAEMTTQTVKTDAEITTQTDQRKVGVVAEITTQTNKTESEITTQTGRNWNETGMITQTECPCDTCTLDSLVKTSGAGNILREKAEINTQTDWDKRHGAVMTTQTDCPSTTTTQTDRRPDAVMSTQTRRPAEIQTQTDKRPDREMQVQTERRVTSETQAQTERKIELENMTQTERTTELESMTQTDIKLKSEFCTQTDNKQEVEITTQTEITRQRSSDSESQTDEEQPTQNEANQTDENQTDELKATQSEAKPAENEADQIRVELEELGRCLEQRFAMQKRYQELYEQERSKNALLQKWYHEELEKKNKILVAKEKEVISLKAQRDALAKAKAGDFQAMHKQASDHQVALNAAALNVAARNVAAEVMAVLDPRKQEAAPVKQEVAAVEADGCDSDDEETYDVCDMGYDVCSIEPEPVLPPRSQSIPLPPARPMEQPFHAIPLPPPITPEQPFHAIPLPPPITPLPPPMVPEVLPAARVAAQEAAIRAVRDMLPSEGDEAASHAASFAVLRSLGEIVPVSREGSAERDTLLHLATNAVLNGGYPSGYGTGAAFFEAPSAPEENEVDEERFEDADGEPQKLCPVCSTTFPADLTQSQFEMHVDSHYGAVCPMCQEQFPVDFKQELFEDHVNSHFLSLQD